MTQAAAIDRETIKDTDPLLLRVAAKLAYPDGSMSAVGLRKMAERGLLDIEEVCGRHYTSLADIEEMRRRCRVQKKAPGSISESARAAPPSGRSEASGQTSAQAALSMNVQRLRDGLRKSSPSATARGAPVVQLNSRSRTS